MNRVIIYPHEYQGEDPIELTSGDYRFEHIKTTLNLKVNSPIKLCLLNQGLATGKITHFSSKKINLKIVKRQAGETSNITLVVGLSRPPTCKKILEHGTSMGIKKFIFFRAELSEKSYFQSTLWRNETYRGFLHLGLAQSGCYYQEPEVEIISHSFNFENLLETKAINLVFDKDSQKSLLDLKIDKDCPINLLIGPERGWTDKEIKKLNSPGFETVSLCPATLRVEVATFAALSQLHLLSNKASK